MEETTDYPSCSLQNSFISTLDHLPCDIVRSLWLIQSCNLKIDKYKQELNDLLEKYTTTTTNREPSPMTSHFLKRIVELKKRIQYLSRETIQESRAMNNQLITHKLNLLEEMNQLKKIEISKHNLIDDVEMKELRQQLKTHYNEHPLVSQMEAVQEQKDLITSSNDKSKSKSDNGDNTNGLLKSKITEKPEKSKLKLILRIPKQDKVIKPKNKKVVKKLEKKPTLQKKHTKRKTDITKDDKKSTKPKKKVQEIIELKEEPGAKSEEEEEEEDNTLYCFCKQPSFGNMISCDNESSCPNGEWFHYKCVGLLNRVDALKYTTGKESWYCSENCKSMALLAKQKSEKILKKRRKRRNHW